MKYCATQHGNRVAYAWAARGSGVPLVLVHGFCEDHLLWASLQSSLKPASILLLDLPGFGQSELPQLPEMQSYAVAVKAVLDTEEIEQCVLIGHSMGGYAALEFAAHWPERLVGLGLFHSHPFEDTAERKIARQRGIETLQAGKRDLYVAQLFPNLFAESYLKGHPDVLEALISNGKNQSPKGIIAALQAMLNRRDHQKTLCDITCPVLFLLGQLDTLVPPEQALKAALLPTMSDLHLLPEAAHMAMFESSEETVEILNSFWDFCGQRLTVNG